jgi:cytochrome b561
MDSMLKDTIVAIEVAAGLALGLAITWLSVRGKSDASDSMVARAAEDGRHGLPARKYHPVHVAIHWFVVFVMAQLLTRGALIMVNIPNSNPEKVDALRAHSLAGVLVLVLMLARLVLLKTTRLPQPASAPTPFLQRVKHFVHPALYVSIFVQVFAGLGLAYQAELPRIFFLHEGSLPKTFWIYPLRTVHYLNSRLLIGLIGLHIAGALYHTLIMRDGLLQRMSFSRRLGGANGAIELARAALKPLPVDDPSR